VIKCRPQGYFARFQSAMTTIRSHLEKRIATGRWPCRASRGRHWLAALKRKALAHLGLDWLRSLLPAFDRLLHHGIVPVSRSF
jgi:hypothetical protein